MDISSLLSPQEGSPDPENVASPPPRSRARQSGSSRPAAQQRKSSNLSKQVMPDQIAPESPTNLRYHPLVALGNTKQAPAPGLGLLKAQAAPNHPSTTGETVRGSPQAILRESHSPSVTPNSIPRNPFDSSISQVQYTSLHPPPMVRTPSTPQMDALADLASMQQNQQQPSIRSPLTAAQATAALGTTATSAYSPSPIRPSASRNPTEQTTTSTVSNPGPKLYATTALSSEELSSLNETSVALHENSLQFQAHIDVINLLHKAFTNQVQETSVNDTHSHELAADLRQARETMVSIYPLGEDLLAQWITDERTLARTIEDHQHILQLCARAVGDEPHSAKLWRQYGEYIYHLYNLAHDDQSGANSLSEEQRSAWARSFSWASVNEVWERGVLATQWRLNDSNIVWDLYMEVLLSENARGNPQNSPSLQDLRVLFEKRLIQPHATWDQTFQAFSAFVSTNLPQEKYEELMASMNQRASQAKQMWSLRESSEFAILAAAQASDRAAELEAYAQYLTWEVDNRGVFSGPLVVALYERAITRFPSEATLWEQYVEYIISESSGSGKRIDLSKLPILERATRHCPWSGSLWSYLLLALEIAGKDFQEMERVKHAATKSGILELFGMEELLKVYIDWCGFLRRRAFGSKSSDEDDLDIAEVGIKSAIEHVKEIGERMVGKDQWQGDPHYRLERIHVKFFTQAGNTDVARKIWQELVPRHCNDYNFWYRFYIWEMVVWSNYAIGPLHEDSQTRNPTASTDVLKQALQHTETMDMPESLLQMYLAHCEQHESVAELLHAHILVRKLTKQIQARRLREHEEHAAQTKAYYEQQAGPSSTLVDATPDVNMIDQGTQNSRHHGKRKLDAENLEDYSKKQKTSEEPKRDRERATVLVKNLPGDATVKAVRKFFRGVGDIIDVNFADSRDESGTTSATVEFANAAEAEYAQSRDGFGMDGHDITISYAAGTTIWVTNYPPEADEDFLRRLFEEFGDIVDVRLPSLQGNTHRRFCYIQFATPSQATAATSMHGFKLPASDGKSYSMQARISDPSIKEKRQGAMYEGREVIVKQLHFQASEAELKELFSPHGQIESVRIAKKPNGQSKGSAFIIFATPEEAKSAATALTQHEIRGRKVIVEVTTPQGAKAKTISKTFISEPVDSQLSAAAATNSELNGAAPSPGSASIASADGRDSTTDAQSNDRKERTLYLINIPDTVNDTRVRFFLKPYGNLRQITLRPDHQGAIVEFATIADAGKAEMRIPEDKHQFVRGKIVEVVTEAEFRAAKPEYKPGRIVAGAKKPPGESNEASTPASTSSSGTKPVSKLLPGRPISRPGIGAGRGGKGGRRGGLGFRSDAAPASSHNSDQHIHKADDEMAGTNGDGTSKVKKSNDDFRALLAASKTTSE